MYQPLATANGDYSSYVDNSSNGGIGTDVKFNVFGALQQAAANFAAANFDFSYPATSSSSNSCSAIGGNGSISHFTPPTMMMAPMVSAASCSSSALSSSSASASALHLNSAGPAKRERTKYSEYQLAYLNAIFRETKYPDGARREEIAQQLQLTDVKVQVWFKNRRAKVRNEVNIEKKLEAAKIVASRKTGAGGPTKREASVEDTEEEDQQQQQRGKSEANGNKKTRHSAVKTEHKSNNVSNSSPPPPPPLPTFPLPAPTADDGTSFLASAYQQQLPKAADVGTFGQCWPTTAASATSASLMQMAAAFPSAGHNFYSGWPQAAYTPPSFLSSAYPASQMFGQLAGSAASYYPSAAGTAGGQCGYYFPAQQAVQQQQQQPD